MKLRSTLIFALAAAILTADTLPTAQEVFDSKQPTAGNQIALVDGYAFAIVEFPVEKKLTSSQIKSRQMLGTFELVQRYCQADMQPLQAPFKEKLANALGLRPAFKMPKLNCNVVRNDKVNGKYIYVTAFSQKDLDALKERYTAFPPKYSIEEWLAGLRALRKELKQQPDQFDGFLSFLDFPERILASKAGIAVTNDNVDLQALYTALSLWSPERNSVYKAKHTLEVAPGFPPAMLVLADDAEKNKNPWEAINLRLLAWTALDKKQEVLDLCRNNHLGTYDTLLDAYFTARNSKSSLPATIWKNFGHCSGDFSKMDLAAIAKQSYKENRPLEGIAAANQLLRSSPDSPEAVSLLAEGYRALGLDSMADGASWYLLSLDNLQSADVESVKQHLANKYASVLK